MKRNVFLAAFFLFLLGAGLVWYKTNVLDIPFVPSIHSDVWHFEAQARLTAKRRRAQVRLLLPSNTRDFRIQDENFVSQGFSVATVKSGANRRLVWSSKHAKGKYTLSYRAIVRSTLAKNNGAKPEVDSIDFEELEPLARKFIRRAKRSAGRDTRKFVKELARVLRDSKYEKEARKLLQGKRPSKKRVAVLMASLLQYRDIPARLINGIRLERSERNTRRRFWLEVYLGEEAWQPFDLSRMRWGKSKEYFPWWSGEKDPLSTEGMEEVDLSVAVNQVKDFGVDRQLERKIQKVPWLAKFSIFQLPVSVQVVFHVILLIPIGALLVAIIRNVIGVQTFGTFMPVLIALAFRETKLFWGIVLFTTIVVLALLARFCLERLQLLAVPRLAANLTIVVIILYLLSFATHHFELERGLSIALFPLVIIAMTVERMSLVWEEVGPLRAIQQGIGSLLVAALTYLVITISWLEYVVVTFPEVLLIILACILIIGRYTGYRLTELYRFRGFKGSG